WVLALAEDGSWPLNHEQPARRFRLATAGKQKKIVALDPPRINVFGGNEVHPEEYLYELTGNSLRLYQFFETWKSSKGETATVPVTVPGEATLPDLRTFTGHKGLGYQGSAKPLGVSKEGVSVT